MVENHTQKKNSKEAAEEKEEKNPREKVQRTISRLYKYIKNRIIFKYMYCSFFLFYIARH